MGTYTFAKSVRPIVHLQFKPSHAFATELTRIRIRNTGVIHLIMTVNSFSPTNLPLLLRTSSEIVFGPTKKPTKMQVKKATIGIMTLLLMKSMISRMVMPAR